jgi:hypothetical protein
VELIVDTGFTGLGDACEGVAMGIVEEIEDAMPVLEVLAVDILLAPLVPGMAVELASVENTEPPSVLGSLEPGPVAVAGGGGVDVEARDPLGLPSPKIVVKPVAIGNVEPPDVTIPVIVIVLIAEAMVVV